MATSLASRLAAGASHRRLLAAVRFGAPIGRCLHPSELYDARKVTLLFSRFFSEFRESGTPFASYSNQEMRKRYEENRRKKKSRNSGLGPHAGKVVILPPFIHFKDLAKMLKTTAFKLAQIGKGQFDWWPQETQKELKTNQYSKVKELIFSFQEAAKLAKAYKRKPVLEEFDESDLAPEREEKIRSKVPVITILGHVDHGKTTLLDFLRGTRVAANEPFGITQDTYCFQVKLSERHSPTFLDTPGHQNFFNMRSNGAFFSDLVLLVVAADEGCCRQSVESLKTAQEHRVPICVAINKIDARNANVDAVKNQLEELGLILHDVTLADTTELSADEMDKGHAYCVPISALKGTNIPALQQSLARTIDALHLTTDLNAVPEGTCHPPMHVSSIATETKRHICVQLVKIQRPSVLV